MSLADVESSGSSSRTDHALLLGQGSAKHSVLGEFLQSANASSSLGSPLVALPFFKAEILSREHPASAPPFLITVSTSRLQQNVRKDVVDAAQAPRG
ncbi:hypothetical protein PG989_012853 [Apiospora arundinis]